MNRLAGIIVAVAGLVVAVLGIAKILPGLTQAGLVLLLFGLAIVGLSFVRKPDSEGAERMSTPATLLNIFVSPAETFQNLRRHPRWLVAALIVSILSVTFTNLFIYRLTPERVTNYAIDKTLEMPIMNEEARRQIEAGRQDAIEQNKNPVLKAGQAATAFAGSVLKYSFFSAVLMLLVLMMGGRINFWQAFSVAVYAAFPTVVLWFILSTVVLFVKDPVEIHPILGQAYLVQDNLSFLFKPSEHPALYSLMNYLSLLWFYWIWLLATGLKNAGEKVSGGVAWTAPLVLYGLLMLAGVISSYLFSGFMS